MRLCFSCISALTIIVCGLVQVAADDAPSTQRLVIRPGEEAGRVLPTTLKVETRDTSSAVEPTTPEVPEEIEETTAPEQEPPEPSPWSDFAAPVTVPPRVLPTISAAPIPLTETSPSNEPPAFAADADDPFSSGDSSPSRAQFSLPEPIRKPAIITVSAQQVVTTVPAPFPVDRTAMPARKTPLCNCPLCRRKRGETVPIRQAPPQRVDPVGVAAIATPLPAPPEKEPESTVEPAPRLEMIREQYANGSARLERQVWVLAHNEFVNHGPWRMMSPLGELIGEGVYRKGLREGEWTRRHERMAGRPYDSFTAPFLSKANFRGGELHGTWVITDAHNRPVSEIPFEHGKRHGIARWYEPSGAVRGESRFEAGRILGVNLSRQRSYHDAQRRRLRSTMTYRHAPAEFHAADDWWEGRFAEYRAAGKPVRHGECSYFYPNGRLKARGQYADDRRDGQWILWHANGTVAVNGSYRNGKRIDGWKWWDEAGELAHAEEYPAAVTTQAAHYEKQATGDDVIHIATRQSRSRSR